MYLGSSSEESLHSKVFDRIPLYTEQATFNMGGGTLAANVLNKQPITRDGPPNQGLANEISNLGIIILSYVFFPVNSVVIT